MLTDKTIRGILSKWHANRKKPPQKRLNQKQIAELFSVSRTTVSRVLRQKRKFRARNIKFQSVATYICPTCRNKVIFLPCVICAAHGRTNRTKNVHAVEPLFIGIDLTGDEQSRYLALKHFRENHITPYFSTLPDDHPLKQPVFECQR